MPPDPTRVPAGADIQETQFSAIEEGAEENSKTTSRVPQYGSINEIAPGVAQIQDGAVGDASKISASTRALAPDLLRGFLMVLQAIDHCSVSQGAWRHGVALESESDGTIVDKWNTPTAWIARMLTHLCAPGFMFLLGMGVVYFGRSRSKLGWSSWRMARHFTIRAVVLAAINEVLFAAPLGFRFLILNIVLLALAVNYLLAGLLWLAINASERFVSRRLEDYYEPSDDNAAEQSLLQGQAESQSKVKVPAWTLACSWNIHNAFLLGLTIITIAWNHWLSPHQGHCPTNPAENHSGPTEPSGTNLGPWFDFWFIPVMTKLVISPFPPLGWLSPAILGVLYGRVILSQNWRSYTVNASNALVGVFLMLLFALTRLLHFGNLSEDCLRMPEQVISPNKNQYLASFRSFFYITKYPPSFSYISFTMSINFLLLALFGTLSEKYARRIPALLTFGQSALFFYCAHLWLYFGFGALAKMWFGQDLGYIDPTTGKPAIGTSGRPAVMWITWALGLAILWPLCRWYAGYKSTKGVNSVWRFF